MQYSQAKRGTSNHAQPFYSRTYPDTGYCPVSQPTYMMNTADNGIQVHGVSHACPGDLAAMPYFSHEECSQRQPHETCTRSHEHDCQYHPCVGARCPYLPHLNQSFAPNYTNQRKMDRLYQLSHKQKSTFLGYQNPSSSNTIKRETAPIQYDMFSSFVPSGQSTMLSQQTNNMGLEMRDFHSQVSTTPRLSQVTTPDSIFSAPLQSGTARNGSREVNTPASTISVGHRHSMQKGTMSPVQVTLIQDRDSNSLEEGSYQDDWLSELNKDNQNWSGNNEFDHTQPQPLGDSIAQQPMVNQYAIQPLATTSGTYLHHPNQSTSFIPKETFPNPLTESLDDWDSSLDFQNFPVPPTFEELTDELNGEIFEQEDASATGNNQNALPHQQFSADGNTSEYDFNTAPFTIGLHDTGYGATTYAQPAMTYGAARSGTNGGGGKGRQGNQNADKDALLVRLRDQGKSYKEIMQTGYFDLQESTLRGRYRTLTKDKDQRVRKPTWSSDAVQALLDGVDQLAPPTARHPRTKEALDKVPWKKVAEWMRDNRGCYHYGNATVKKKYRDIVVKWKRPEGTY